MCVMLILRLPKETADTQTRVRTNEQVHGRVRGVAENASLSRRGGPDVD